MLDSGLLISWGEIYPGREEQALLRLFSEVVAYGGKLLEEGRISGFEPFVLRAHGDLRDLRGFMIIRGTAEQIATLRRDDAFLAYVQRAKELMNDVGVDELYLGEALRHILEPFETRLARSRSLA
jgi:hypothetical protein